jgi:RNA polymerase sigma-70 factor (ECF subfamily)
VEIDATTIEACRNGDRAALERVLREHAPMVERLIARMLGRDADLEDLVQQTLIAAVQSFPRFRGEASVKTWMARIAVNIVRQHLRRPYRRRQVALELVPERETDPDRAPDQAARRRRALDRLFHHLDAIGDKKRIAFVLHVFEGHSIEEVAALTGASKSATKSRIFWCRRALLARAKKDPELAAYVAGKEES